MNSDAAEAPDAVSAEQGLDRVATAPVAAESESAPEGQVPAAAAQAASMEPQA